MFSLGAISESQASSVNVGVVVKTGKVGNANYGSTMRQMEQGGGGTAFTRAGTTQEYTEARADANASTGSDPQPLDIMVKGNIYRCVRIMNFNDIGVVGTHIELASTDSTINLSKTDIAGISTELGFLPSSSANFSNFTISTICEPFQSGVVNYVNQWSWDTETSSPAPKTLPNILGFVSGATKTVEIVL